MEKNIRKKQLKAEKEKLKKYIQRKLRKNRKILEKSKRNKKDKRDKPDGVVKTCSSTSTSSSHCNCSFHSGDYSDSAEQQINKKRKRTYSQDSKRNKSKRIKIEEKQKSFESKRKMLERTVERKYSQDSAKHRRGSETDGRKSMERGKRRESNDRQDGDAIKEEYNKRLDCLARYGKNFYCPTLKQRKGLRPIYIDGSNVAFSHGQNERFSVKGLKICIDYFRKRGHEVKAFVPNFRLRKGESTDQQLLHELVKQKLVITTPTLYIQNQQRSPYDDWYIIQSAAANGGIIVSADNFQDILRWNPNLRSVIEEARLVPTFVDDMLIFPVDPHGNRQNNLEEFLKF